MGRWEEWDRWDEWDHWDGGATEGIPGEILEFWGGGRKMAGLQFVGREGIGDWA